jgi:hypothetical protein
MQDNRSINFVAACSICNGLKSSMMFQTEEEARVYIYEAWQRKGFSDQMPELRDVIYPETPVAEVLQEPVPPRGVVRENIPEERRSSAWLPKCKNRTP